MRRSDLPTPHAPLTDDLTQAEQANVPTGNESRNPDGTFKKGSPEAVQAGHVGGLHAAGKEDTVGRLH